MHVWLTATALTAYAFRSLVSHVEAHVSKTKAADLSEIFDCSTVLCCAQRGREQCTQHAKTAQREGRRRGGGEGFGL